MKPAEEVATQAAEQRVFIEDETAKIADKLRLDDLNYNIDERNLLMDVFGDPFRKGLKRLEQDDISPAALLFEAAVQKKTRRFSYMALFRNNASSERKRQIRN